jgi:hypothetical protein
MSQNEEVIDARKPTWPGKFLPITGVVMVATGPRFLQEAAEAAAQLKKTNPSLPLCIVADDVADQAAFWDHLVLVRDAHRGFRDKILMGLCPYERFLYLDTDAYVIGDLTEMLGMLHRFDFIGHQLFEGHDCPLPGIPDAFPEFQGGVVGLRRCAATVDFFPRWLANFDRFYALNTDGHYHYSNASDQKSLRLSVWESGISVGVLGPEYDFTPHHLDFACSPVRILHGRGKKHLDDLARRLNAKLMNRVYVPRFDVVIHNEMLSDELRRLWWAATLQIVRRWGNLLTPLSLRNRLRRSSLVRRLFLQDKFCDPSMADSAKWKMPSSK